MSISDERDRYKKCMNLFFKCNRLHHAMAECRVRELGLHRSQHTMLMTVNHFGNMSQKDIAKKMEISPAAVTVTLKKLEALEYVERVPSANDSRINNITITNKGRNIVSKTAEIFDELDRQIFAGFSDDEINELYVLLKKISDNMSVGLKSK